MEPQQAVFINVFAVEPDRQGELVALLTEGGEQVIRHRPGFTSLSIYASRDGRSVVGVAGWARAEDAAATQAAPDAASYAARAAAVGTPAPGLYTLAAEIR
ncbi:hypothetical protein [Microbacterium sp. KNMS]